MIRSAWLGALCAAVLGLAPFAAPAAQPGGELKIGITQYPSTFNPLIDPMVAKSYVLSMARRPTLAYDQDWKLVCMLCVELPSLENGLAEIEPFPGGGEGIAMTFRLQPDAAWGDGTPVTSEDVVFTWQVGRHPQSGVADIEGFKRVTAIDVIGPKTYRVHYDRVTFDYQLYGGFSLLPAHLERPIFEADPGAYRNRNTFDRDPTNPGLYFGPYRIAEVAAGSHIALEANPTWYGQPPAFGRIVVRVIENTAALEANLLSGAVDMIAGELGLTVDQALAFAQRHGARYDITYKPGLIYEHIDLNLDNPILKDPRVRRALVYALDRKAMTEQLFAGHQPVADANVSPLDWVYSDDIRTYPYDPERAARLLDAAGWGELRDGVRHNAAGAPLTLEFMTTAQNRTRELVQQVLQSQWRDAGIDVRIRNEPARVFFGETVRKRKFAALAMFAWLSSPESVPRTTLKSTEIPSAANGWGGQNYTGYRSAEMDRLIDAIERELDPEKRKDLWGRLQALYAEDLPVIPLYWRAAPYILPKWLSGVRPTGHQGTTTLWVEEWKDAR